MTLTEAENKFYKTRLLKLTGPVELREVLNRTICQNLFAILDWLPKNSVDLVFADPPYNLTKTFNDRSFSEVSLSEYEAWLDSWVSRLVPILKPTASIYICGDWRSSTAIHRVINNYFKVQNRITWEREKGRGAKTNWKNCSEDIWFCTVSNDYTFNVEDVMLKRRVLAPYTEGGEPKNWRETNNGRFRLTHPSNIWTDLTVPFWSMPENTDHPTQKPEKLVAKAILASSNPGDIVFDPFVGSGTTSVVAKKLGRNYVGVEVDEVYCCLTEKRLALAEDDTSIQGYAGDVFWERNSLSEQNRQKLPSQNRADAKQPTLF
jgi:site-specific DNA-methyltransferase (adenine-specific)